MFRRRYCNCTNHKVSLAYCVFPRQFVLRFSSTSAVCVAPPLAEAAWSHHRHVDYTRATFGPLHTFVSSTFFCFPLSHSTFLLGRVLFLGTRKILNSRKKSTDFRSLLLPTRPLIQPGPGGQEFQKPSSIWVLSSSGGSYGRK